MTTQELCMCLCMSRPDKHTAALSTIHTSPQQEQVFKPHSTDTSTDFNSPQLPVRTKPPSHMDGLVNCRQCCFLNCFTECWVAVAGACNVLSACTILHCQHTLWDKLPSVGSHDPGTKDLISVLVTDELDLWNVVVQNQKFQRNGSPRCSRVQRMHSTHSARKGRRSRL